MIVNNIKDKIDAMFSDLTFDSQRHLYFWQGNPVAKSVSGKIDEHIEKVDFEKILPFSAKKEGCSVDELRNRWKKTNKDACDMGTETHDFLERYTGIETPNSPQKKAGVQFFKDISDKYEIVYRELRMYSREYKYAGTADLLLLEKSTGKLVIADYKTNKDLFKSYQNLKIPFDTLEATAYNKYQLQLSYYQLMLEEIGFTVSERLLVYLKPDGTYRIFNTLDFVNDLKNYLESKTKMLW